MSNYHIEPMALDDADIELSVFIGADGALVVQIDTQPSGFHLRVNVNDAPVFDQDPEGPPRIDYAALSREMGLT